jgi:hypothetical protein
MARSRAEPGSALSSMRLAGGDYSTPCAGLHPANRCLPAPSAHWASGRPTIRWWTSKSACSAFPRTRHSVRGGCSGCALTESAWSCHRPCITTTRPGARPCGRPRKRRRPATRGTRPRRRDAGAASTALSPGRSTHSPATFATPPASVIRGPTPRLPAPGAYSLTCEASGPSAPGLCASPCPEPAGPARPRPVKVHGCSAIATAFQSAERNAFRGG